MITITESKEYSDKNGNQIIGKFTLSNSKIQFGGKNNIVFMDGVELHNSTIYLRNNNSLIFIEKNKFGNIYQLILSESCVGFIRSGFTAGRTSIRIGDGNVIFGNDCMLSQDIYIQNHDGHAIYDIATSKLLNTGKSIVVGDHVWVGEGVSILKGSIIGSGSVIGASSLVSNKSFSNNSIIGGSPARIIRNNIFWTRDGLHCFDKEKREKYLSNKEGKPYIFQSTDINKYIELDNNLSKLDSSLLRLKLLLEFTRHKQN